MQMMLRTNSNSLDSTSAHASGDAAARQAALASPLVEVLWRRRLTLVLATVGCLVFAALYLVVATKIYRATARLSISQNGPKVFAENQGFSAESDSFLQTQADVFESKPVVQKAFDSIDYRSMKSFATFGDDPVEALRRSGMLKIEAGKKSDVVSVSVDSPSPTDAAAFANALVNAYIGNQGESKRSTGESMVGILEKQKEVRADRRRSALQEIVDLRKSFRDADTNASSDLVKSLETTLTATQVATIELRARLSATKAALSSPEATSAYVDAQQAKAGRDGGDREYDELKTQRAQAISSLAQVASAQGVNSPRTQMTRSVIESLNKRIAAKQRDMLNAQIASLIAETSASEQKENDLHEAIRKASGESIAQTAPQQKLKQLDDESEQLRKEIEVLDTRIAEVRVNSAGGEMNANIIEPATPPTKPVKPGKSLVLAFAMLAGMVFGSGIAMFREWSDARVRSASEITAIFGVPVLATVPRVNSRLSSTARGQLLRLDPRSVAAEAYRSIRTSIHLSAAGVAKTVLVASPTSGDGKSTTASNLAIAFAESGDRTLLIDCDLRRPVQHLIFELEGDAGLSTVMSGEAKLRAAIAPTRSPNLFVLPCGPLPHNPTELLTSKRFGRLMQALTETFDRIVIDSPPLSAVADGRVLAAPADCTVLVFRVGHSSRNLSASSVEGLEKIGANVVGAVANDVQMDTSTRYYGGSWAPVSRIDQQLLGAHPLPSQQRSLESAPHESNGFASHGFGEKPNALAVNEPDWSAELS